VTEAHRAKGSYGGGDHTVRRGTRRLSDLTEREAGCFDDHRVGVRQGMSQEVGPRRTEGDGQLGGPGPYRGSRIGQVSLQQVKVESSEPSHGTDSCAPDRRIGIGKSLDGAIEIADVSSQSHLAAAGGHETAA